MSTTETRAALEHGGKNDEPLNTTENFLRIMLNDRTYAGIKYNELAQRAEIHETKNGETVIRKWSDADEAYSRNYIEHQYKLYSKDKHSDALRILFAERKYNPIIDIVESINWDGEARCSSFLSKWCKAEDSEYTREVSRLIFAGGIHRLYHPGIKFDDVPILIGT